MDSRNHLIETIRDSIIGDDIALEGPFGPRRVTYADYTASGRSLSFIEEFIRRQVLPLYANTHTEVSSTGLQTNRFREEARNIIRRAVGATEDDVVIFCGSGATSAIVKMIDVLNLRVPADLDARFGLTEKIPAAERPVVFLGPYEHHSNELPWRESIADVVLIDEDADGHIDQSQLEKRLEQFRDRSLLIGSFSAASNVTGIESDIPGITELLHRYGALAFWDYAAAAPYVRMDVTPGGNAQGAQALDAIFLSPHKFAGGPGTPGVLVAKRRLFSNRVPVVPGGGTVSYVSPDGHRYIEDREHREEGGTPAIVESIRAGLVFQLKSAVGSEHIEALEEHFIQRAIASWQANPKIRILGNLKASRLSIVSLMVVHDQGFLHHNFVIALLNDLFGIQARGGCSCAGPYGHRLLGIDLTRSMEFEKEIRTGCELIKPGWVRMNFNYFISEAVFEFLLAAVHSIARRGWVLLPQYAFDPATGVWRHRRASPSPPMSLNDVTYRCGRMEYRSRHIREPEDALTSYLEEVEGIFDRAAADLGVQHLEREPLSPGTETLRWFPLPSEIETLLRSQASVTTSR